MLDQPGKQVNQEHKALRVILGLLVMKVHKGHKDRQGLRVQVSAMEMPRGTSSTGMGLPGRT
jgi:hypothetical protein